MLDWIKRIGLLALSSLAILITVSIIINLLQYFFNINLQGSGYQGLLILSLVLGFGSAIVGLWTSRWMAKKTYNIQLFDHTEYDSKLSLVYQTVARIAQQQGITIPQVGYYASKDANAFATGPSKNSALVAVSTGLIQSMNDNAIRGVIGHEMAHVLNGDMVTTTMLQGVLNTLVIFMARLIAGLVVGTRDEDNGVMGSGSYFLISNVLDMIFGLGVSLILMRHSRTREYAADAGSVTFLGSKQPMLDGLQALQGLYNPSTITKDPLSTLKISGGIKGLFASHPPIQSRINALQKL